MEGGAAVSCAGVAGRDGEAREGGAWPRGEGTRGVGGGVGGYDTPDRGESAPKHEPEHELLLTGGTHSRAGHWSPISRNRSQDAASPSLMYTPHAIRWGSALRTYFLSTSRRRLPTWGHMNYL